MLTDNVGLKYGYNVTDYNKTTSGTNIYSRLSKEAASVNLEDNQVINQTEQVGSQGTQGGKATEHRFNPDKSIISEEVKEFSPARESKAEKAKMQEIQNKILNIKEPAAEIVNDENSVQGDTAKEHAQNKHDGFEADCPLCDCETCKNRRYQDGSNDSAVSFQQPTKMSPEQAASMVKSHEMEHVRREQYDAKENNKRIVSQSVQIKTDICPECGKTYVAGGLTRTRTKHYDSDYIDLFKVGAEDMTAKEII